MRFRHALAVALVSLLIATVGGRIAWGLFLRFDDFRDHLLIAQRLSDTWRPAVPHFLFHGATAALYGTHALPSLLSAGALVVAMAYAAVGLVTYVVVGLAFRSGRPTAPWILATVTLAVVLVQPITAVHAYQIGYLWPEPYHSPTYAMLKPLALASFAGTAWLLSRRERQPRSVLAMLSVVTALAALSKPSFLICVVPATTLLLIYGRWRRVPQTTRALIAVYTPALLVLLWQFITAFSGFGGADMYQESVAWAPLKVMRFWSDHLTAKFLASTLFPLTVLVLYWQSARNDRTLQLAWLCFAFGVLYTYGLAETFRWRDGNFLWSGYITLFTLFVATIVFWLRESTPPWTRWRTTRTVICGIALALHVGSGVRMAGLYLTHGNCRADLRLGEFICS